MVATQRFFIFIPIPGEMIQFDEHIFQMGWNHQLEKDSMSGTYSDLYCTGRYKGSGGGGGRAGQ